MRVASESLADRIRSWRESGLSETDAADLAVFDPDAETGDVERLEGARRFRSDAVEALRAGVVDGKIAALVLLAETLGRGAEAGEIRVFCELLGDAALLAAGVSTDLVRHQAVTGPLSEIGRAAGARALARAATLAADSPSDSRRGNRRLHFEKVLLDIKFAR